MTGESGTSLTSYRMGWWVIVAINGLSLLNHLSGPFLIAESDPEALMFLALAAMNTYALVVLLTAYRHSEPWAWWLTWIMIAIYGSVILFATDVGRGYLGAALVMALAQFMTWQAFREPRPTKQDVVHS